MEGMDKYEGCLKDQQVHPGTFATWLLLKNAGDTTQVMRNLSRLSLRAEEKDVESAEKAGGTEYSHRYFLTPLADTHLHGAGSFSGNHRYLNIFALVAALILLLALLNYMSLATARAMVRAKEVGVRKVMGARRSRIAAQFYTESALYAVLSFLAAIVVFLWLRIWFFGMIHQKIDFDFLMTPRVLVCFAALLGLVIFISGSYPALVMSAFRPVTVLYGKLSRQRSGERIRKGFIVLQFTISMALVICCVVIGKQLRFLRHTDTGVDRENVLMLPFGSSMKHYGPYKQAVAALPAVIGVATTHYKLYAGGVMITLVQVPGKTAPVTLYHLIADSNFVPLMGLKWKEKPIPGNSWFDRNHLVLNETAVQDFDLRGRATGRPIHVDGRPVTVMGVLRDFNFWSLHQHIEPLSITVTGDAEKEWGPGIGGCLYVKLGSHANIPTVIEGIRKIYSRFDDLTPFEFQFLDEAFDSEYKLEDQLAELLKTFTLITIVIACLGLFALATFAAQQRVKEIGIRKVLGASVGSIGALLSLDFLRPVLLAALIASPLSWWLMNKWLQDFAYLTSLSWWIFLAAGIGLLLVALVTVLFRTIRAAQANPTINLRSE